MRAHTHRHALTLVELLVVVTILVILVAVVLPLAAPALRGREVREGARQLNALLARIQTEAVATGKAHGVALVNNGGKCFEIVPVKERGVYTGVSPTTRITYETGVTPQVRFVDGTNPYQPGFHNENIRALTRLLTDNNENVLNCFFKFNYRGKWHQMRLVPNDGIIPGQPYLEFIDTPPTEFSAPANFQIKLPPRRSASLGPTVELPQGAFIDMSAGASGWTTATANDFVGLGVVVLMFGPEGQMSEVWPGSAPVIPNAATPLDNVFLRVESEDDGAPSYWVTIGNTTNRISTTENIGDDRAIALEGLSAGGR